MQRRALIRGIATLLFVAGAWCVPAPAQSNCPATALFYGCAGTLLLNDAHYADACTTATGEITLRSYDLRSGDLSAAGLHGGDAEVWARDDFLVTGPAAGTPVHVVLHVEDAVSASAPSAGSSAGYVLELWVDGQSVFLDDASLAAGSAAVDFDRMVAVGLDVIAGTEFRIEASARCGGSGDGNGAARAHYAIGLPRGVAIESCHGYGASPTPSARASWGRVKSRYR